MPSTRSPSAGATTSEARWLPYSWWVHPDELAAEIARASKALQRTRADIVRQAVEYHLEDLEDLALGLEALRDPSDPVLDWKEVRDELLAEVTRGG